MKDLDDTSDTITISTDMFSSYAIAYVETESTGTGDELKCGLCHICPTLFGICYFIWMAVIILLIVLIGIVLWKRREESQDTEE